jgi:uncharacterized protein YndB with AHSA1/START domain
MSCVSPAGSRSVTRDRVADALAVPQDAGAGHAEAGWAASFDKLAALVAA